MRLETLHQPCNNSTLMGVMRGAADHYKLDLSTPMLHGLTGHAWLLNIHRQLCPSGPYCWDRAPFYQPLANAGLKVEPLGFYWTDGGQTPRAELEQRLRAALDEGLACFLVNMEYQLIWGYDDTGFLTAQPWAPHMDFPPAHLTFGTWAELGGEVHCDFHIIRPAPPKPRAEAVTESLEYVRAMWTAPDTEGDYGFGPHGYTYWREAIAAGHGEGHGNWWNGTVYAECRANVGAYLREVGALLPTLEAVADRLARGYDRVAEWLKQAADKALAADAKLALLAQAAELEAQLAADLAQLLPPSG